LLRKLSSPAPAQAEIVATSVAPEDHIAADAVQETGQTRMKWKSDLHKADNHSNCLYYMLGKVDSFVSDPFFVQVGAMDGIMADSLHAFLRECDWTGVLVEPLPDMFERLKQNYAAKTKFRFENVAICPENGTVRMRRIPVELIRDGTIPSWAEGISALEQVQTSVFDGGKTDPVTQGLLEQHLVYEEVEGVTFRTLADRADIRRVTFVQIDTEGYDWKILAEIERAGILPLLINIEVKHMPEEDVAKTIDFFERHGYDYRIFDHDAIATLI
jgi:FkbM family methyltransferase